MLNFVKNFAGMKKSFAILLVAAAVCFITDAKSIRNFVELMSDKNLNTDLPIIDYLKSIIDAGHWDAYSSYVYTLANGEEPIGRQGPDAKKIFDFLKWLQQGHSFVPNPTKFITQRPKSVE